MQMIVCDDNTQITDFIKDIIIKQFPEIEVIIFHSGKEMVEYITRKEIPDIIITDICLGEEDGIEVLKQVRDRLQYTKIIFFTGFFNRCQDIFINFNPYGLLTKPIKEENLQYYLKKIMEEEKLSEEFYIQFRGNKFRVSSKEILFLESKGRKVIYHTRHNDFEEYIRLDDAMKKVKNHFVRCHKSYGVNLDYVTEYTAKALRLVNGAVIPVSRNYTKDTRRQYMTYMAESL